MASDKGILAADSSPEHIPLRVPVLESTQSRIG